jgi:subtilase family serine protease
MPISSLYRFRSPVCVRTTLALTVAAGLLLPAAPRAFGQDPELKSAAPTRLVEPIDEHSLVTLKGNVRKDLSAERDLGSVQDSEQLRLMLVLKRSDEQQADLDTLLARQQQPGAKEYHKWLTPKQFGARFGAAPEDLAKLTQWLGSHGFEVKSVLNNRGMIDFAATSAQVREAFHTQLHYYDFEDGKHIVITRDPQIPAALTSVVAGVSGLNRVPKHSKRTPGRQVSFDAATHSFRPVGQPTGARPEFDNPNGDLDETPQDFYTIYNAGPIYSGGNLGAGAAIGVPEPTDMEYGTVSNGQASGGDVATFRTLFGVAGTLNMSVMHGAGSDTCGAPGITAAVGEAALDAEWANAVAPNAHVIFMSCDTSGPTGDGFQDAFDALIDNNISDVITSSYGTSEINLGPSDFTMQDTLVSEASSQGQTIIDAAGDAGAADDAQNTTGTATNGLNTDSLTGPPLITAVGGTDFQDQYDADEGGLPQSTYWAGSNSATYESALSYIPETPWNSSCADSIIANDPNYGNSSTPAGYCASFGVSADGTIIGGGGGFSSHYAQGSFQTGIKGLTNTTQRAVPDIAFFAASGFWGHNIVECDSSSASTGCTSTSTFEEAGGTSFAAPQFAGVAALLVTATGERQGSLNPGIYALAKAQYTAGTSCYANGQTSNIGTTTGAPASTCIFHDITTGNNDEACQSGSTQCYTNAGATFGVLSQTGSSSLTIGYASGVGYDEASGLGSLNIANFINKWNTAFTSSTGLAANPTSIAAGQSTSLTATVTGGQPAGYSGAKPAITGTASFKAGTTPLGSCTLSNATCSLSVPASSLQSGANSVTATFAGSGTYPSSTSSIVTVTVTGGAAPAITFSPTSLSFPSIQVGATSTLPLTITNSGSGTLSVSAITAEGANASLYTHTSNCGGNPLAAGSSCTAQVTFTPTAGGTFTATLNVTDNVTGSPQSIAVTGTATTGGPAVTFSPTSLSFASTQVGSTTTLPLTITNSGTTTLNVSAISQTGANGSLFSHTSNCGGNPIAPGGHCTAQVTFTPTAAGSFSATLSVTDNAGNSPQAVAMTGTAVAGPIAQLSATSLSFPSTQVGATSSLPLTITNSGSAMLHIVVISSTGTNASLFTHTSTCGGSELTNGQSCSAQVIFTPTAAGSFSATLSITDNAPGSPQTVTLSGTATAGPAVTLSATSLSFPSTAIGSTSTLPLTITNSGSGTLNVSAISLSTSSFGHTSNCGGNPLAAGKSCTAQVTFSPASAGTFTATLSITDNATGSPQTITVSGTGH